MHIRTIDCLIILECYVQVVKLCDLGIDDSVSSVGWAQRGTHLAVGTSNGKIQVWNAKLVILLTTFI